MREDEPEHVRHFGRLCWPERVGGADQDRAVRRIRRSPAVRSPYPAAVQRDHIHHVTEAECLLEEAIGEPQLCALAPGEKQLRRVVAGLAMNVHGWGEVGRSGVVEPVVIGEPGVGGRHRHQFTYYYWLDEDRKSTRLNSSHLGISYAVF